MKTENENLLETFTKITLGELIKPIKRKIAWIETEERTYFPDCYQIYPEELVLYRSVARMAVDHKWSFDTEVKVLKNRIVINIEGSLLSFATGRLYKF
jgi:hypothetical protein